MNAQWQTLHNQELQIKARSDRNGTEANMNLTRNFSESASANVTATGIFFEQSIQNQMVNLGNRCNSELLVVTTMVTELKIDVASLKHQFGIMGKKHDVNLTILNAMCEQLGVKLSYLNQNDIENTQGNSEMDITHSF